MNPDTRISLSLYPSRGPSLGPSSGLAVSASCEQIAARWRNVGRTKSACEHLRPQAEKAKQSFVASARKRGCFFGLRHLEQIVCKPILRPQCSQLVAVSFATRRRKFFGGPS